MSRCISVKSLEIEGFRGIGRAHLNLDRPLTVLVGENGTGKTTVLDALAILLDNYLVRYLKATPQSAERLKDSDVSASTGTTKLKITINSADGGPSVSWELKKQLRLEKLRDPHPSDFDELNAFVRSRAEMRGNNLFGEPLLIYYGERRAVLNVPQRIRETSGMDPESALSRTLTAGDLEFREFVAWFRDRTHFELEHLGTDSYQSDPQLRAVRAAMTAATEFSNPRYSMTGPPGLYVTKNGVRLRVNQLSSGEQTFLALAGDLARRLAMLNPGLDDPLSGNGIVLIDEIELHLHPRWQRKIIPWLRVTFPNCQFIVTTHSPQVLGEVHADDILILRAGPDGTIDLLSPKAVYGRDSNYILLSVLGADERDADMKARLDALEDAIDAGRLEDAAQRLSALRTQIEGEPPELTIAQARLERRQRNRDR